MEENKQDRLLFGIIADDFTGVCDTGAQFASAGLRTIGSVTDEFIFQAIPDALILNTQSRGLTAPEAFSTASRAVKKLSLFQPTWVFKKIDTALRGNIAAEVLAVMDVLGRGTAFFAGAIPRAGRTTVGGFQYLHGIPITESILGEDRLNPNPVFTSRIADLFSDRPEVELEFHGLDQVRSRRFGIQDMGRSRSKKILIFDAETDGDLDQIVKASMGLDPSTFLYIGASGLAAALARHWPIRPSGIQKTRIDLPKEVRGKRVLIVSGSPHPATQGQIAYLREMNLSRVIGLEPNRLLRCPLADRGPLLRSCEEALDQSGRVTLSLSPSRLEEGSESRQLPGALAEATRELLGSIEVDGLVVLGGETVYAICRALGIDALEILGEISFVAAYGRPLGASGKLKTLVTKGGSLGDRDILEKVLRFLTKG